MVQTITSLQLQQSRRQLRSRRQLYNHLGNYDRCKLEVPEFPILSSIFTFEDKQIMKSQRKFKVSLIVMILLVSCMCGFVAFTVEASGEFWWNTDFAYRKAITFNNSAISENLANFPMPIVFSSSQTDFWSHVNRSTGSDVRFVDADNQTELYFEIEQFDTVNNVSVYWVQVPQVDSASTTDFVWLYYGNNTCALDTYNNKTQVWDSTFVVCGILTIYWMMIQRGKARIPQSLVHLLLLLEI